MPFAAAVALYKGSFGWDDYALLAPPSMNAIANRVDVRQDEHLEALRHPFGNFILCRRSIALERRIVPIPQASQTVSPMSPRSRTIS